MALLTDDQKMLQETAASFLAEEGSIAKQLRHWRDIGCTDGFGHALWKQFAELGLTGICIPESHGGMGLGAAEAALVLEEIGRNLTPSPFLTSGVVGARAIEGTSHADRWPQRGHLGGDAGRGRFRHGPEPDAERRSGAVRNSSRNVWRFHSERWQWLYARRRRFNSAQHLQFPTADVEWPHAAAGHRAGRRERRIRRRG